VPRSATTLDNAGVPVSRIVASTSSGERPTRSDARVGAASSARESHQRLERRITRAAAGAIGFTDTNDGAIGVSRSGRPTTSCASGRRAPPAGRIRGDRGAQRPPARSAVSHALRAQQPEPHRDRSPTACPGAAACARSDRQALLGSPFAHFVGQRSRRWRGRALGRKLSSWGAKSATAGPAAGAQADGRSSTTAAPGSSSRCSTWCITGDIKLAASNGGRCRSPWRTEARESRARPGSRARAAASRG